MFVTGFAASLQSTVKNTGSAKIRGSNKDLEYDHQLKKKKKTKWISQCLVDKNQQHIIFLWLCLVYKANWKTEYYLLIERYFSSNVLAVPFNKNGSFITIIFPLLNEKCS